MYSLDYVVFRNFCRVSYLFFPCVLFGGRSSLLVCSATKKKRKKLSLFLKIYRRLSRAVLFLFYFIFIILP